MSPRVELIYDLACPNVEQGRAALLDAFARTGIAPAWTEWDSRAPDSPDYARSFGSPTILVDGLDVAGVAPGDDPECCRVYGDASAASFRGVPPVQAIADALLAAAASSAGKGSRDNASQRRGLRLLGIAPGVGAALLPVGVCPACWPAYAGLLSTLGLGFLLDSAWLLPLTSVFFLIALASLVWRARSRHGYKPLALGVLASTLALLGKFAVSSDPLLYLGLALLIGASLWHSWPRKAAAGSCSQCAPQAPVSPAPAHPEES